jgi:N-acylneuraminate cytidylyltransferase
MSKAIALIPARSGSKRVKDKNILKINGHPLLAYTISLALKSKIFDRVICVTDSKEYKKIAQKYGAEVPKLRPKKYSGDKSSDIEWVMWIMRETKGIEDYEIFSILRPKNHLRKITTTRNPFKLFKKKKKLLIH